MYSPLELPAWRALEQHFPAVEPLAMRDLFAADPNRFSRFSRHFDGLLLDFSKNRITPPTFDLLVELARQAAVPAAAERMFSGEKINSTEGRAVLHVALRNRSNRPIHVDGQDVMPGVNAVLTQMRAFTNAVRTGAWTGYTGRTITDIVNIGIGGSDLGPHMAVLALEEFRAPTKRLHFVSNVDGHELHSVVQGLRPHSTLFLIASKTFSTAETMTKPPMALILRAFLGSRIGSAGATRFGGRLALP